MPLRGGLCGGPSASRSFTVQDGNACWQAHTCRRITTGPHSGASGGTFVTQVHGRDPGLPQIMNRHLKDEAYRIIKEAITTLQFRPGEPVMEGKLAKSLGISKTPVRNALVRL